MAKEKTTKKPAAKTAEKAEQKPVKKSKKGWMIGLIVTAVLVVIGAIVAAVCLNKTDPADPTAKLNYSKSFFIYDNDKYTLWNADGKRLSEDEFDNHSDFIAGYAAVKKDNQYGIIKDGGTMAVDFGKYGNITARGGLYLVQDGNTKEYYLLTGSGRELERGDDLAIYAPGSANAFAVVETGDKVKVYTYDGKLIKEVEVIEGVADPVYEGSHDFGLFYYDNQNLIFDVRSGEVLAEFEGPRYEFDDVSDDRGMVLLQDYKDSEKYKLIVGGKVYDLEETKYYALFEPSALIGYDNYSEIALLDDNYKVAKRVSDYLALKDWKNYATENENDTVEIYYNGEKVKEFGDGSNLLASGVLYEDYYAIKDGDKAKFYGLDGSVGIDHEYRDIRSLFDQHHHAIVSDTEGEYYLIDAKGNQVGDTVFKGANSRKGGYELKNSDGKYAIAGKDGKPVTDFKYESVYYRSNAEPQNIWTGRNADENYDVIDVENGKVLLEGVNVDSFYTNYFTVRGAEGTEYYTYDGELFYTVKK